MSANMKLSKLQIRKMVQTGGFSGRLLGRFLSKLIKRATSVEKNILPPLGLLVVINVVINVVVVIKVINVNVKVVINVIVVKECTELVKIKEKDCLEQDKELKKKSLMPPHPLTTFQIIDYFKNEPRFNGVFSRRNLPKTIKKEHMS